MTTPVRFLRFTTNKILPTLWSLFSLVVERRFSKAEVGGAIPPEGIGITVGQRSKIQTLQFIYCIYTL
jgi:hypothetical protein